MTHGTAETSVSSVATIAPAHALAVMVAKIGCIIFVVEILIMIGLYGLDDAVTLGEGMFDATILTLVASPLIYLWVARPFADDAAAAREKLATQLSFIAQFDNMAARLNQEISSRVGNSVNKKASN